MMPIVLNIAFTILFLLTLYFVRQGQFANSQAGAI